MIRNLLLTGMLVMLGTGFVPTASADTTLSLSSPNMALSGVTGPYGSVDIALDSSTEATITFTAGTNMLFGDSGVVDVNINATSFTISGLTGTPLAGFSGPSLTNNGSKNVDGFGTLNQTFEEFDGFGYALSTVSFTVTDTSGTWSSSGNVLTSNGAPNNTEAAAHIFVCGNASGNAQAACSSTGSAFVTGYAGNGGSVSTPEPTSLLLLGTALALAGKFLKARLTV